MDFLVKTGKTAVMVMLLYALFGENICQGKLDEQFGSHFRSGTQKRTAIDADRTIEEVAERQETSAEGKLDEEFDGDFRNGPEKTTAIDANHTIEEVEERQGTSTEDEIMRWLNTTNEEAKKTRIALETARSNHYAERNPCTKQAYQKKGLELQEFLKTAKEGADNRYSDEVSDDIKRQLKLYSLEYASPNLSKLEYLRQRRLLTLRDEMRDNFIHGMACYPNSTSCAEWYTIQSKYATNSAAWRASYEYTVESRSRYIEFVRLQNTGATDNGFRDRGDYLRQSGYETPDIVQTFDDLYNEILPMYRELHAYLRRKVRETVPHSQLGNDGPIPGHLHVCKYMPFPNVNKTDVGKLIKAHKFNAIDIAEIVEEKFLAIGLYGMTKKFWEKSIFVQPASKPDMSCRALAFDFRDQDDFRVQICGKQDETTMAYLAYTMGQVKYYMAYRNQSDIYRTGANDGFREAVGELFELPYHTQDLLGDIFKCDNVSFSQEQELNFLMTRACFIFDILTLGYATEKWRWGVYDGSIPSDKLNRGFWKMMLEYHGVIPPTKRNEKTLDAAGVYQVPLDLSYISYFTSSILQYQFYEAVCREAGHTGELHKCNFYKSPAVGEKLKSMLEMGRSQPWEDALEVLTGQRKISASGLLKYFEPLMTWLETENEENSEERGWMRQGETVESVIDTYITE